MFSAFRKKMPLKAIPALEAALARVDSSNLSDDDLVMLGVFGATHSFWDCFMKIPSLPDKFKVDGIPFEISAYLIFRADFLSFEITPGRRQLLMTRLHQQSEAIFQSAFAFTPEAFAEMLNNRLEILGHIVRSSGATGGVIEALLLRFIYDTVHHAGIPQYGLDHHKPITLDQTSDEITRLLKMWHPVAMENVKACVRGSF